VNADFYTTVGFWVTVAGTTLGFAGIAYGGWARSHPKDSRLICRITESALVPRHASQQKLTVHLDNQEIGNPHIVTVEISNLGPLDLTPKAFDGGYLRVAFAGGASVKGDLSKIDGEAFISEKLDGYSVDPDLVISHFTLSPRQLKRGETITATLLLSCSIGSSPGAKIEHRLADFNVTEQREPRPRDVRVNIRLMGQPLTLDFRRR
jgi:hypothetical protein